MSVYAIFETTVVVAAVAAGAASALRTFAPGLLRRLQWWKKAPVQPKLTGCDECGTCGGCGRGDAGSDPG